MSNVALTRVGLGLGLQRFIALPLDAYEFADGLPGAVRPHARIAVSNWHWGCWN